MDSEARENEAQISVCPRCFASVSAEVLVCPECGAPLDTSTKAAEVDTAVHADLAQANLLRVRGDLGGAERQCLGILKRFPNDPSTHTLLGDVAVERGDLAGATQWYELALDISPNSAIDKAKLHEVRKLAAQQERAQTEEHLQLPPATNTYWWVWVAIAAFILTLGTAYFLGQRTHNPAIPINGSVQAPEQDNSATSGSDSGNTDTGPSNSRSGQTSGSPAQAATSASTIEDRALLQLLQQRSAEGSKLLGLIQDPRTKLLTLTFSLSPIDDPKKIAATLAKDAFDQSKESLIVTLRGVSGDHLAYAADANRSKLDEIESAAGPGQPPAAALVALLQNEWAPPVSGSAGATTGSTATTPPESTTGTAPPSKS